MRNSLGHIIEGSSSFYPCCSVVLGEALALKEAVLFAIQEQVTKIVFESDSCVVVNVIKSFPVKTHGIF